MFKAVVLEKNDGTYSATLKNIDDSFLNDGDVTVAVDFSSLNYKDALAISGKSPVVRHYPMIPGIDLAGTVIHSTNPLFTENMSVIATGWGLGERYFGGYSQKVSINSEWLMPLPSGFSLKQAMSVGTAGLTAMLAVLALERNNITPEKGDVLVTGATGGVGSFAISILAKLGYRVVASTGKIEVEKDFLSFLGATEVLFSNDISGLGKSLEKERWAGVIDVVGSKTLAYACASAQYGGTVVSCGLAGGIDLPVTVAPFILRGVSLIGIDSVKCPTLMREQAWRRLSLDLNRAHLDMITTIIGLSEVIESAGLLINRQIKGRLVIDLNA